MPIAAHAAGEYSTLDVLLGLGVLIWALATVVGLLVGLTRLARRVRQAARQRTGRGRRARSLAEAAPPVVPDTPNLTAEPTASERSTEQAGAAASSASVPPDGGAPPRDDSAPIIPGARHSPETLEPLAGYLRSGRLRALAEARVADTLSALPADRWSVERYVPLPGHRLPFLILGETGVFAVWALSGPPMWHELQFPSEMAAHVKAALPGYSGPVQVGICRALASTELAPRWWCRPGEPGAWVMGREWLIRWIEHFGPEHGLGVGDIERLRTLAEPRRDGPPPRVPDVVPDLG